ncbi:hypothetical protein [Floridanema aerugineum]|jgi:hypothetical protein|uniref:Uncharacterized protein n=1 Tax=Floridaenema aerugineum BLCC-F46 TaxID=3153654 RepID=A0ABV4X9Q7_9CYAN
MAENKSERGLGTGDWGLGFPIEPKINPLYLSPEVPENLRGILDYKEPQFPVPSP